MSKFKNCTINSIYRFGKNKYNIIQFLILFYFIFFFEDFVHYHKQNMLSYKIESFVVHIFRYFPCGEIYIQTSVSSSSSSLQKLNSRTLRICSWNENRWVELSISGYIFFGPLSNIYAYIRGTFSHLRYVRIILIKKIPILNAKIWLLSSLSSDENIKNYRHISKVAVVHLKVSKLIEKKLSKSLKNKLA